MSTDDKKPDKAEEVMSGKIGTNLDAFPTDETPTPTKILKLANEVFSDLQDPKENPFDVHFRKAAEAVKSGSDSLSASMAANDISSEESLNTPSIFPTSALSTPTPGLKRVSPKQNPSRTNSGRTLKPLLPNEIIAKDKNGEEAQVLLKLPTGETFKLHTLPLVKEAQEKSCVKNQLKKNLIMRNEEGMLSEYLEPSKTKSVDENQSNPKKEEIKERNRFAAMRSRNKKRQYYDKLEQACKKFSIENNILRQEIIMLKKILQDHVNCDITLSKNDQTKIRNVIEPHMVSCAPQMIQRFKAVPVNVIASDIQPEDCLRSSGIEEIQSDECIQITQETRLHQPGNSLSGGSVQVLSQSQIDFTRLFSEQTSILDAAPVIQHENSLLTSVHDKNTLAADETQVGSKMLGKYTAARQPVEELRSPPQVFPEDLTTVRHTAAKDLTSEVNSHSSEEKREKRSIDRLFVQSDADRKVKRINKSLTNKLDELKKKMNQDKEIDEFIINCRSRDKVS